MVKFLIEQELVDLHQCFHGGLNPSTAVDFIIDAAHYDSVTVNFLTAARTAFDAIAYTIGPEMWEFLSYFILLERRSELFHRYFSKELGLTAVAAPAAGRPSKTLGFLSEALLRVRDQLRQLSSSDVIERSELREIAKLLEDSPDLGADIDVLAAYFSRQPGTMSAAGGRLAPERRVAVFKLVLRQLQVADAVSLLFDALEKLRLGHLKVGTGDPMLAKLLALRQAYGLSTASDAVRLSAVEEEDACMRQLQEMNSRNLQFLKTCGGLSEFRNWLEEMRFTLDPDGSSRYSSMLTYVTGLLQVGRVHVQSPRVRH